jgi:hypothetical protein
MIVFVMSPRQLWEEIYARFDPEEPARSSEQRAKRMYSPADAISRSLRRSRSDHHVISGTSGSGLSTELYRIAEQCTTDSLVVFLDVHGHFAEHVRDVAALDNVQPWELLVLVGLAVLSAGERRFGHRWSAAERNAIEDAVRELATDGPETPTIDVAKLGSSMAVLAGGAVRGVVGTALSVLGEGLGASEWSLPIGIAGRRTRPDQDKSVRALLDAVNHLVDVLQTTYERRLTLTIDGLDRIRRRETAENLFVRSNLLTSLVCPTVAVGPLVLCRKGRLSSLQGWQPKVLANAPVMRRDRPLDWANPGDGVAFLQEVFRRRVSDLPWDGDMIPAALLDKLAYFSGGRTRDFVRFIRLLSDRCWDRELAQADARAVDEVIDERRRLLEAGLNRRHVDVLRVVLEDPQHMLPDDDIVDEMLDNWWLLPYPNESEWYQPHPLLMLVKLRSTITG